MILCDYMVGVGGNSHPTIILNGRAGYIGDDLKVGRVDLITRINRNDLILELYEEDDEMRSPVEWVRLVGLPSNVAELLAGGAVITMIDGDRHIGIVDPVRGIEQDNGVVNYVS